MEEVEIPARPAVDVVELETTEAGQKAAILCRSAEELKAHNVAVLDVRGQTILADFFVLCTGTSNTHIQSIARHCLDQMRENGFRSRPEGSADSFWVVLDYGDAILHVLSEEMREFYDLERLWADAKIMDWPNSDTNG